jgi:hypothetical protein
VGGFLTGHLIDLDVIAGGLSEIFGRFQINTHAQNYEYDDGLYSILGHLSKKRQTVIFQLDGKCGTSIANEVARNGWTNDVAGLFDLSHGAGVLPEKWPDPIKGLNCGYAGGLCPINVADQLAIIEKKAVGESWIDAETKLFSQRGDLFDLEKVEQFLEAAKPWVI